MASAPGDAASVIAALQRELNALADDNRSTRKRSLLKIRQLTVDQLSNDEILHTVFSDPSVARPIIKCFEDPLEKCRELSAIMIGEVLVRSPPTLHDQAPLLLGMLARRLAEKDIVEPSEEVRLELVQVLSRLLDSCDASAPSVTLKVHVEDMLRILARTLTDPYPDIKKMSCQCVVLLSQRFPEQFLQQAEHLSMPLLTLLSHQHSRVRLAAVLGLGAFLEQGTTNHETIRTTLEQMGRATMDAHSSVRNALTSVTERLLTVQRDRYSHFAPLLLVLLPQLSDEYASNVTHAAAALAHAGRVYAEENRTHLKDACDWEQSDPSAPEWAQVGAGATALVHAHSKALLDSLLPLLTDWALPVRTHTLRILSTVLHLLRSHATPHLDRLFMALRAPLADSLAPLALDCIAVLGRHIPLATTVPLLLPRLIRPPSDSPSHPTATLRFLRALLDATTSSSSLPISTAPLETLLTTLTTDTALTASDHTPLLEALALLLRSLAPHTPPHLHHHLFFIAIALLATHTPHLVDSAHASLRILSDPPAPLFARHFLPTLSLILSDCPVRHLSPPSAWHSSSHSLRLTLALLASPDAPLADHLEPVLNLFSLTLDTSRSPELRLKMFSLLSHLLEHAETTLDAHGGLVAHTSTLIESILLPNCTWHSGQTACAIRTAALSSLWSLLRPLPPSSTSSPALQPLLPRLLSTLLGCIDDRSSLTRSVVLLVLQRLLQSTSLTPDQLHSLYPDLIKRLDDHDDQVRVEAIRSCRHFVCALPSDYDSCLYAAHLDALFSALFVHLDDPDESVQAGVLEALKAAAPRHAQDMVEHVAQARTRHRTMAYLDALEETMKS